MDRTKQLEFCKICENQKFDTNKGIICSLTNDKADFIRTCLSFKEKPEMKKYNEYKNQSKEIRYPALNLVISAFQIFGWIVGIATIGIVIYSFMINPNIIYNSILLVSGLFISIINIAISEILKVIIDIEKNTRKIDYIN